MNNNQYEQINIIEAQNKKRRRLFFIGPIILLIALVGITYAFYSYTRTGATNVIKTGRVSFTSSQDGRIRLNNAFPITSTEAPTDNVNSGEVVITLSGDTVYSVGIEYLVTVEDVKIETSTHKKLPIGLIVTPEADNTELGTANVNYFNEADNGGRGGNTSYYKVLAGSYLKDGDYILVGYIRPGVAQVNGKIGIRAFIDKNKILISDTYNGTESDNMGTTIDKATGKVVLTTTEWNSIQGSSSISFRVRVQANEGIWLEEPATRNDMININSANVFTFQEKGIFTEINFIRMSEEMINTHANLIDLTASGGQGVVKAWVDGTRLYIASPGETYFPVDSSYILSSFSGVTKYNFNNINTSLVENMSHFFAGNISITNIDLDNFDTGAVSNMNGMFVGCRDLETIDLSGFDTSSVSNMSLMFNGCSSLESINISNFITDNVTNFSLMFTGCVSLLTIDLSSFEINSMANLQTMFANCENLSTIYVSNTWDISSVTNSNNMFSSCTSLVGGNGTRYIDKANTAEPGDNSYLDKTYAVVDDNTHEGYLTLKTN